MRKIFIGLAAAGALVCAGCSESDKGADGPVHNVFAVEPEPVGMAAAVTLPGRVEEARTISVGFKTAGQLERIYVHEGQRVGQGQLIAMLDTADYALGISALREKYRQLSIETERRGRLHASGNMSDNDYENALSGLRQLEIQLRLEENKLGYCRLTAPAAGVVTKVNFEASEMVDAGTPVVELMDNSALEVLVDLPVSYYAARETFTGFTDREGHALTMLSLTPKADNSQLYTLRLGLGSGVKGITPGMNMAVTIHSDSPAATDAVTVPLSAVFDRDGRPTVWVINADSTLTATPVVLEGTGEGGRVTVGAGLTPAQSIVRAGVHHLTEGEKVAILPAASATYPGNVL